MIKIDIKGVEPFASAEKINEYTEKALIALEKIKAGSCRGSEMLGWLKLPETQSREIMLRIKDTAARLKKEYAALVIIGIGGSYIGARAGIELVKGMNYNVLPKGTPDIYFAGNNFSGRQLKDVVRLIGDRDFGVIVISKSGTTIETAVSFRLFRAMLEEKYGNTEAAKRIIAITDDSSGALRKMAEKEGWESFSVPGSVGGRYSVLTPVGLLPMACAGIDPHKVIVGAFSEMKAQLSGGREASAVKYAAIRNLLYKDGFNTEVLSLWEAESAMLGEWWKQLFAESEGKERGGILPTTVNCTTDLHSLGQYIQQGRRDLMETLLTFEPHGNSGWRVIPHDDDSDGVAYLEGRTLIEINQTAAVATKMAHIQGGVPCTELHAAAIADETVGSLLYFFELACAISGTMQGVNPFDQPGVEEYKRNMFALLGKPGYRSLRDNLIKNGK